MDSVQIEEIIDEELERAKEYVQMFDWAMDIISRPPRKEEDAEMA